MALEVIANPKRVLVADPDPELRRSICSHLVQAGYQVVEASDGRQVLSIYEAMSPDAVVIDRELPDLDGLQVASHLRGATEEAPVPILVTGSGDAAEDIDSVFRAGGEDYVTKPVAPSELVARLHHALQRDMLTRQLVEQNIALETEVFRGQADLEQTNHLLNVQLLNQQALLDLSQQLNTTIDLDEQIHVLLPTVMSQLGISMAALFTLEDSGQLELHAARGVDHAEISDVTLREEGPLTRYLINNAGAFMLQDLSLGVETGPALARLLEMGFVWGAPIHAGDQLRGFLALGPKDDDGAITSEEAALIMTMSVSAGIAMEKAYLFLKLQETYVATIQSLMSAVEARDTYTRGHTARVARYSMAVGEEMGFSKEALQDLKFGSALHDIGKIGIADGILNKPGRLTDEEMEIMRRHPEVGDRILRKIDFLDNVRPMVRSHHERIDGKGYPDGLIGDEIGLGARIVTVVDSFDAMTSKRTYSDGMGLEEAFMNLTTKTRTQFDPEVVAVFIALLKDGTIRMPTWMKP